MLAQLQRILSRAMGPSPLFKIHWAPFMRLSIRLSLHALLALAFAASSAAQCPEVGPLDHSTGMGTTAVPGFVSGEEWGATFATPDIPTADFPIKITKVGFAWGSVFGGGAQSLEQAIHFYEGAMPNPGAPIFSLPGPVLSDGFINEFDVSSFNIVANSSPVTITIELANDSSIFGAAPAHDGAGCSFGKNVIFAIPGGWNDGCALGITGNWVVQLHYESVNCGGPSSNYCPLTPNSAGLGASIGFAGSASIAANDLILTAEDLPSNQIGLFFYGPSQIQVPFGDGNRCVGGVVSRLNPPVPTDLFGNAFRAVDYSHVGISGGPNPIVNMSTFNFQFWFRDPAAMSASGFNLTNGLEITFQP
jgi:hypothetical protein